MAKKINTRIQLKHDLEVNWNKATDFVPMKGEVIIYDKEYDPKSDTNLQKPSNRNYYINYCRFKIGDGETNVNSLPFQPDPFKAPSAGGSSMSLFKSDYLSANQDCGQYCAGSFDGTIYHEFYSFEVAPVGYTRTDYYTIDGTMTRYLDFIVGFYFDYAAISNLKVFVKPSASMAPNWTLSNTVGELENTMVVDGLSGGSAAFFSIYLPCDARIPGSEEYRYNNGIVSIKVTKLSLDTVLVEPDLFIQ
jgi:hypothetical protein